MQKGSNSRRSRGRGNGGKRPQKNHNFDSSGPEGRVRGNAQQVYEKYVGLARDAQLAGDRIATENYFQHAEHYLRVLMASDNGDGRMEAFRQRQQRLNDDEFGEGDDEGDELSAAPQQNRAHQQGGYQGDGRPQQDMRQDRQDNRQDGRQDNRQEGRQDRSDNRQDNRQDARQDNRQEGRQDRQEGRNQEGRSEGRQEGRNPEGRSQEGRSQEGRQEGRREGRQNNRNNNGEGRGEPRNAEPRAEGEAPRESRSDAPREGRGDAPREGRAPREDREGGNARRVPIERATERPASDEESDDDGLRRTLAI